MELYNLRHPEERVSFAKAARVGIGQGGGLFFPARLEPLPDVPALLELPFVPRSVRIAQHLLADELGAEVVAGLVERALTFPVPVERVTDDLAVVELFHGPTLAFKDFGARFLAEVLAEVNRGVTRPLTILTATSGDTGAAVAHAFYGRPGVQVVVLYPQGRIAPLQEKLFCTLGGNVHTLAVEGDFDACQALAKGAFADPELTATLGLNSANSINIARLLAQVLYYFEAVAQRPGWRNLVVAVPSGNFGNLTAGLLARRLGLPIRRLVAATNANDTVPRYLAEGRWEVRATVPTLSNAMDVAAPNNWPRVEALGVLAEPGVLTGVAVTEAETRAALHQLETLGYLADPHTAVAFHGLQQNLAPGEQGLFLATAHPAKFQAAVEEILGRPLTLPPALAAVAERPLLSRSIPATAAALREELLALP